MELIAALPTLAQWVHDLDPFALRFPESWPVKGIRWYGLAYAMGFLIAVGLLQLYYRKGRSPMDSDQQTSLMTAGIIGTLLGGRLGYMLFYKFDEFVANPLSVFAVWEGGMASHGGMIGILCGILFFSWRQKHNPWQILDIAVTVGPPGIFLGRIANFINAELWGKPTNASWGVLFPRGVDPITGETLYTVARHPSQLYEALGEGLILFVVLQLRFWLTNPGKRPTGRLAAEFLIVYAVARIACEFFREPDEGVSLILGMNRGMFYSLFMIVAGIAIWIWRRNKPGVAVQSSEPKA